jgi:hypothetical protein
MHSGPASLEAGLSAGVAAEALAVEIGPQQ